MADEGEDKAAGTTPQVSAQTPRTATNREQSEWTVSDTRGPLSSADAGLAADEPTFDEAGPHATHEPTPIHEPGHEPTGLETAGTHAADAAAPSADAAPLYEQREAAAPEEGRRSLPAVPIALAVIIGAIIGAGSAAAINMMGGTTANDNSSKIASLSARVTALETRPEAKADTAAAAPAFDPAPLQQKLADLQSQLDGLKQQKSDAGTGGLDGKVEALDGKVAALDGKVTPLAGSVDELKAQGADVKDLGGKVAALAATLDGLKKEDATTTGALASLQDGQKALEAKITSAPALAVVADSLVAAIDQGQPYANQVAALGSLGADPAKIAILKENADKGVPSSLVLAQKFTPLADTIMAAASKPPPNAGFMDRLKSGMASMVTVRSAGGSDGDDAGSRVSRIEADLAHDDVAGAYAAWDGLPADAKAKTEAWGALAKTHVEAMDAARALQQQSIATLGGRKS